MRSNKKLQASLRNRVTSELRSVLGRLFIAALAYAVGLIGSFVRASSTESAARAKQPSDVRIRYTNQRTVLVHYRWTGPKPKGVQLWLSEDGRLWMPHRWSGTPDKPLVLTVARQGRIFIAISATHQAESRARVDLTPAVSVIFDWDKPLLKLHSVRLVERADATRSLCLDWSAWDENLGDRPISLYWRRSENEPWKVGVRNLPNCGSYEWPLPGQIGREDFSVSLRAADLAGNSAEAIYAVKAFTEASEPLQNGLEALKRLQSAQRPLAASEEDIPAPATRPTGFAEAERLCRLAAIHLSRREFAVSEALLRKAIQLDPTLPQARCDLGNLLQRSGRHKEAIAQYEALLAIKPDSVAAWRNLALAYIAAKNYSKARVTLQKLLAIRPTNPQTWLDLGDVEMLAARPELAKQYWQKAKSLARSDPAAATRAAKRLAIYLKGR